MLTLGQSQVNYSQVNTLDLGDLAAHHSIRQLIVSRTFRDSMAQFDREL